MTVGVAPFPSTPLRTDREGSERFRLNRAGILNVWQYDEQEFSFAGGRMLLRGANGAGKSKTLEMLLPFALDGDKARITASAKHHTSLLWLMTDGYDGQARVGYVWVEFLRTAADGADEAFTCGVGIRASASARSATAWHFATSRRIGIDLSLEDDAGPLTRPRLQEVLGADGQVFDRAAPYKEHVGRALFGLDAAQFDEVLRLLYWLRQPQIGEDIEPAKLAQQLSQALPQLDEQAVRSAGDTFDELTAFGEQIERRAAAAQSLGVLAEEYAGYARAAVAQRARTAAEALRAERRLRSDVRRSETVVADVGAERDRAGAERDAARAGIRDDEARLRTLEASSEFRNQARLAELGDQSARDAELARQAEQRRSRQAADTERRRSVERDRNTDAQAGLREHAARLRELDRRQRAAVPGCGVAVPALLDGVVLAGVEQLEGLRTVLDQAVDAVRQARSDAARRTAAVGVVRGAVADADRAAAEQRQAERDAERTEARWERARDARIAAEKAAQARRDELAAALSAWAATPETPDFGLPEEFSAEFLLGLPAAARGAAAPGLAELRAEQAGVAHRRDTARAEIKRLERERVAVEAERDPAPPAPALPRTERPDGLALWQVVDFGPGADDAARAGLEAALQAAGLLDAWLRPGGLLLDRDHHDVVLVASDRAAGSGAPEGTLATLLVPDVPQDADLTAADVGRVLAAIGVGTDAGAPAADAAWVTTQGEWRLGPAHGRAAKPQAQFIGATARAQERARRLAVLDAALGEQRAALAEAEQVHTELATRIDALEGWVAAVPSGQALLQAETRADERRSTEDREEQENRLAQSAAHAARSHATEARAVVQRLAAEYDLPDDRGRLDAVEQYLRTLDDDLRDAARQDSTLRSRLDGWAEAIAELRIASQALATEHEAAAEAEQRASGSRAAFETLRASVGDSVRELEARISAVKQSRHANEQAERAAEARASELLQGYGEAQADARNAAERLTEHLDRRVGVLADLVAVGSVPGMLDAAAVVADDAGLLAGLAGHPPGEPVSRAVATAADTLAALSAEDVNTAATRVWRAHGEAASGPAADHQPVVAVFGDLLAVTGRDDAGEAAVVVLAQRVGAAVERDRDLLTEREKRQFEQHVLGELGDAIRRCRRDAEELVTAMNDQLGKVTTSQGIRVRLSWKLRDDVPTEARAAVELLAQPVGALIPEERASLRDVLHRLIEASRAERPDLSYGEHLAAALDYRTWSEFTIRYTRPELAGRWERLHRRSPLSQGEQKVLCYLPLFAAAAAHFTSLAGAAPYAPRLVLLDDAFPKIDVRTHPLLFGLLVQLDLDFVVTSERLWGDHDTVPSLAIYEALRDPSQRGIAQYSYRWDGRALHALG